MENTLEPGTRRAPAFKMSVAKKVAPKAGDSQRTAAESNRQLNNANSQLVASNKPRNSRRWYNEPMR